MSKLNIFVLRYGDFNGTGTSPEGAIADAVANGMKPGKKKNAFMVMLPHGVTELSFNDNGSLEFNSTEKAVKLIYDNNEKRFVQPYAETISSQKATPPVIVKAEDKKSA